nr:hypothetical protein [Tanacetum cinerariifolium]
MFNLEFCDTHNMVANLLKTEGSEYFHQIMDFLNTSHLKYALTENPTIYASLIQQFWQTVAANTLDTGEGEGSTVLAESHHTPSGAPTTSQPPLSSPLRIPTRQETKVPQPSSPTHTNVADEAASIDLQQTKKVYSTAFTKLIMKVKKLEKIVKSTKARRRAKIVMSDDEDATKNTSKQGRKIDTIDQDPDISLVQHDAKVQGRHEQEIKFEIEDISTAKTLVYIRMSASKDKGKGIMTESEPEQTSTKLQQREERAGYEAAVRLQEQLNEEERQRIARVHEEASSFNIEEWEDIQATIEADEELALKIQKEEREKYSKAEKAL